MSVKHEHHLCQIRTMCHSLTTEAIMTLMNAITCTRVDYGNNISAGISFSCINHPQSVLNAEAWLINGMPRITHISCFLWEEMNWLRMQKHIELKTIMLMRNCLVYYAPSYLSLFDPWLLFSSLYCARQPECPADQTFIGPVTEFLHLSLAENHWIRSQFCIARSRVSLLLLKGH